MSPSPARFRAACAVVFAVLARSGAAQAPPSRDTLPARDTTRLPEVEVRVTRAGESGARLPMAVGVLDRDAIRRAQLTGGLDESLSRLPGVVVLNRSNYSLDQRVSLRGAGSRANFGLRGVKVLLDGIPLTLPDGQSQLTSLDLGIVDRVEVLTGAAGALYGNASGGVIAFSTEAPSRRPAARLRVSGGNFGTSRWQGVAGGTRGRASALLSLSRFHTGGFRQHSTASATALSGKVDVVLDARSSLGLHLSAVEAPEAENPGALTASEYAARRDSAAGANILRGADKAVSQQQLALRYRWANGTGAEAEVTAFGLRRNLTNPLATAPPAPAGANAGTYSAIDRVAGGLRAAGAVSFPRAALRLAAGVDLQAMRDERTNQRSASGAPTGQMLTDQREAVTEVGPFAQVHWQPVPAVLLLGALRYDRLAYRVTDHLLSDGVDQSGERLMESVSGSAGISVEASRVVTLYANTATSFESPTTTELVNTANGTAGFNAALGPQRTVSMEVGLRLRPAAGTALSAAAFHSRIRDAIVQAREQDGRAYFQNAGRVRNLGVELGITAAPWPWLQLRASYTLADYTFAEYRIRTGAAVDTLDGHRLAGVPKHFFRASALGRFGALVVEVEQAGASEVFGDDRNTQPVAGWGAGITTLRLSAEFSRGGLRFEPFGASQNLFDRRYVGSVNLNGFGGRILEPAPGRTVLVGLEVGWAAGATP